MTTGLRVELSDPTPAVDGRCSQQTIAFDNGDAAALDCLELMWQPTGPLALFITEVCFHLTHTCHNIEKDLCSHIRYQTNHACTGRDASIQCRVSCAAAAEESRDSPARLLVGAA